MVGVVPVAVLLGLHGVAPVVQVLHWRVLRHACGTETFQNRLTHPAGTIQLCGQPLCLHGLVQHGEPTPAYTAGNALALGIVVLGVTLVVAHDIRGGIERRVSQRVDVLPLPAHVLDDRLTRQLERAFPVGVILVVGEMLFVHHPQQTVLLVPTEISVAISGVVDLFRHVPLCIPLELLVGSGINVRERVGL